MSGDCCSRAICTKTNIAAVIANFLDRLADDGGKINHCIGGDLASEQYEASLSDGLACNSAAWVLRNVGVEHRIGYLIAKFVWMSLGDGFRSK